MDFSSMMNYMNWPNLACTLPRSMLLMVLMSPLLLTGSRSNEWRVLPLMLLAASPVGAVRTIGEDLP